MAKRRFRPEFAPGAPVTLEIYNPPVEGYVDCRFLAEPGFLCHHWSKTGATYCPGRETCKIHKSGDEGAYVGFVPAERWRGGQHQDYCPCILQISPVLALCFQGHPLTGTTWRIRMVPGRGGNREFTGVQTGELEPGTYPEPFDILPVLRSVFKCSDVKLTSSPVLPSRIMMMPTKGIAPPAAPLTPEEEQAKSKAEYLKDYEANKKRLYEARLAAEKLAEATKAK
jgi:hypothetical protein